MAPARHMDVTESPSGCRLLFLAAFIQAAGADLNFSTFSVDPSGNVSHIRLLGGASLNYYSGEFVETCPEVNAPAIADPRGITQRFQHPQRREQPAGTQFASHTYLLDDQLDNPFAGRISFGKYTEAVETTAFVPDGEMVPRPHNHTQLCHYALRLLPPEPAQHTASWSRFKQLVAYGFETEFHFRILHRSKGCVSVGAETEWCQEAGSDGFAFVVQNEGWQAVGTEASGLGYAIPHSLAVEFDTHRDKGHKELNGNHISVHVASEVGRANTANHEEGSIAYTEDIPNLQEGTHVVRITYNTKDYNWHARSPGFEDDLRGDFLQLHASGRMGLLAVELDGRRVLAVPIDLLNTVRADPTSRAQAQRPVPPDPSAYDDLGASPGRAWVGFTSSSNDQQWQAVDILSWTFTEERSCPLEGAGDMLCGISQGVQGRGICSTEGSEYCALVLQNAARQPLKLSGHLSWAKPFEASACEQGVLEWDQLHPYFLGCKRTLRYSFHLDELWINTVDGTRSLKVTDPQVLHKAPQPFRRRSLFDWCVLEHRTDPTRLQIAQCNCEYCTRLLTLQSYYAQHYQQTCVPRFSLTCQCLEASRVEHDMTQSAVPEPLKNIRLHVCRGCSYNSQCARALKVAICEEAYTPHFVGNPLAPNILNNGFQSALRDNGRVRDGIIRGDACNCEPYTSPYFGDNLGRRGQCASEHLLSYRTLDSVPECADFCRATVNCSFFNFWRSDGECRLFSNCTWQLCSDVRCAEAVTFRLAKLSEYTDLRGDVQRFAAFPLSTLPRTADECFRCLHLYLERFCEVECGQATMVPYLHWPGGQLCSSCIFAGNRMHELSGLQKADVKACVYEATRRGEDPWLLCQETALVEGGVTALDLFNGVVTHHLSECPGRPFEEVGAVCVPNLHVRHMFPSQLLSRMAAVNDTVWDESLECLNSLCQLLAKDDCYVRLAVFNFTSGFGDSSRGVVGTPVNSPALQHDPAGLDLRKESQQYVVSDLLQFDLENITLEGWVKVGDAERVTNLANGRNASANTNWSLDYQSDFALDGNYSSYWSSQLGAPGESTLPATWSLDLGQFYYAGGMIIYWKEPAKKFEAWASTDNVDWRLIVQITDNRNLTNRINQFFYGQYVRIDMIEPLTVRPPGIGGGRPVYSIREVEVHKDNNVGRFRPTVVKNFWHRPGKLAVDGDPETYWSTSPHTGSAEVLLDLSSNFEVLVLRLQWRFRPRSFKIYLGGQPCAVEQPTEQLVSFSSEFLPDNLEEVIRENVQCIRVSILETRQVFGEHLTAIRELQAYTDGPNLAPTATLGYVWPLPQSGAHITSLANGLDGDPSTYWLIAPVDGTATVTLDLGEVKLIETIEIRWATIEGQRYVASQFAVQAGFTLADMFEIDTAINYLATSKRFTANSRMRFVRLQVTSVFGSNPFGRLALEDFIVHEISDNLAARCTSYVTVSSAWCTSELASFSCVTSTSTTTTLTSVTATTSTTSRTTTATMTTATLTQTSTSSSTATFTETKSTSTGTSTSSLPHTDSTTTKTTATSSTTSATSTTTTTVTVTTVTTSTTSSTSSSTSSRTSTSSTTSRTSTSTSTRTTVTVTVTTRTETVTTTTITSTFHTTTATTTGTSTETSITSTTGTSTTTTLPDFGVCNKPVIPQPCTASTRVLGSDRPHGPEKAVDNDLETWWGTTGLQGGEANYLDFTFSPAALVGVVGIRWRYPATEVIVQCSEEPDGFLLQAGRTDYIDSYKTAVSITIGVRRCAQLRVIVGRPLTSLSGEGLVGIRELEIYDTSENLALHKPIVSSDRTSAAFANDATTVTKWVSASSDVTFLTIDLGRAHYVWGVRTLYSSGQVPSLFCLLTSNDNLHFEVQETVSENSGLDVYLFARFTARYVRLHFVQTADRAFSARTIEVYGSPNLAPLGGVKTTLAWNHSGMEMLDGLSETFWISEPFASSAMVQVDLLERIFIAGGIRINWKFPAEDFTLWISNDTIDWKLQYSVVGNRANVTELNGFFEAQFLELRMTRPAQWVFHGSYAIYDFDVTFDENLAHHKTVWASHRINESMFLEGKAMDSNMTTIWMADQAVVNSSIVFEVGRAFVSGFDIFWRRPPKQYRVDRLDPDDLKWHLVGRWDPSTLYSDVGTTQSWFEGFWANKLQIVVEAARDSQEGEIVALREILLHVPLKIDNFALKRPVTVSHNEIFGNRGFYAVDGIERWTYWQPGWEVYSAWLILDLDPLPEIPGELPPGHDVGRGQIFWRHAPYNFTVEYFYDRLWEVVYQEKNKNTTSTTDFSKRRKVTRIRITVNVPRVLGTYIGIYEIKLWGSYAFLPGSVEPRSTYWTAPATSMIDFNTQTYWMSPPLQNEMTIWVDLYKIYLARDIEIWFGFRPQRVKLFIGTDDPTAPVERALTSTDVFGLLHLQEAEIAFEVRYLRIYMRVGYQDPEGTWGTTIRDIAVLLFRNVAKNQASQASSIWAYPPVWAIDGDAGTEWVSRFGQQAASLTVDLGEPKNVAGMEWTFGYGAKHFVVETSLDGVAWDVLQERRENADLHVKINTTVHFRGRFVQLKLLTAFHSQYHPDDWGNRASNNTVYSVREMQIWEHPGGGGVFGIQSDDGMVYSTVAFGLRQPGEWVLATERDEFTHEFTGLDSGPHAEDVGGYAHIIATFQTLAMPNPAEREVRIKFYRNGFAFGEPYVRTEPFDRLRYANATRAIMGVRSSAHARQPLGREDPRDGVVHGHTHSPYFEGTIYNFSIIKNALTAEEVLGLYQAAHSGGEEKGCHCYDACPSGSNRFFPGYPVPCSGQGVCRRLFRAASMSPGRCDCNPGFSGEACQHHCSELSRYGCCEVDDDCPEGATCIQETKACSV